MRGKTVWILHCDIAYEHGYIMSVHSTEKGALTALLDATCQIVNGHPLYKKEDLTVEPWEVQCAEVELVYQGLVGAAFDKARLEQEIVNLKADVGFLEVGRLMDMSSYQRAKERLDALRAEVKDDSHPKVKQLIDWMKFKFKTY